MCIFIPVDHGYLAVPKSAENICLILPNLETDHFIFISRVLDWVWKRLHRGRLAGHEFSPRRLNIIKKNTRKDW
jgi:hypothetical protein